MLTEKIIKQQIYICDQCWVSSTDGIGRASLDSIEQLKIRLFEKKDKTQYFETKNYTNRKQIDFCWKICLTKYLQNSIDILVQEIFIHKEDKNKTLL